MPHSLTHPVVREIVQDQSRTEGAGGIDAAARVADLKSTAKKTKSEVTFVFFCGIIAVLPFNGCLVFAAHLRSQHVLSQKPDKRCAAFWLVLSYNLPLPSVPGRPRGQWPGVLSP